MPDQVPSQVLRLRLLLRRTPLSLLANLVFKERPFLWRLRLWAFRLLVTRGMRPGVPAHEEKAAALLTPLLIAMKKYLEEHL